MSYRVWIDDGIDEPVNGSLDQVAKYIRRLMARGINVEIENIDDDFDKLEDRFSKEMTDLRCEYLMRQGYKYIKVSSNGKLTNPFHFHIPGKADSAMVMDESPDRVKFYKVSLDEAISKMRTQDIKVNEILNDTCGLRGIESYEARLPEVLEEVSSYKGYMEKVKQAYR